MSGGVDSSVAAAMLVEQGYEVIGISMQLFDHRGDSEERFDSCCSLSDMHDARVVAHKLGIPHYVVNYESEFRTGVMDYFAKEYAAGRTPNPCVMCNSKLKFDHLIERAEALGAQWVATGHYARVVHHQDGRRSELYKGQDTKKDQSYFLFSIKQDYLNRIMFPLADLTKPQVREIAARYDLVTKNKNESQEICFVTGKSYSDFLDENYKDMFSGEGDIVDREGNLLGKHEGIHKYTVGQRKRLNLNQAQGMHVAEIDAKNGRIIVDELKNLEKTEMTIDQMNWLVDPDEVVGLTLEVMPRYHAKPLPVTIDWNKHTDMCTLKLQHAARWVSPGQAAVLYLEDRVIGGGFITLQKQRTASTSKSLGVSVERASARV